MGRGEFHLTATAGSSTPGVVFFLAFVLAIALFVPKLAESEPQDRENENIKAAVTTEVFRAARSVNFELKASSDRYASWTTITDTKFLVRNHDKPVLVSTIPQPHDLNSPGASYSIRLLSTKVDFQNKWQIRIVRDSTVQVGVFALGFVSPTSPSEIRLPLNLTAIDTPPSGSHTYSIQIRYVGDQKGKNGGQLEIEKARLAITEL